MDIPGNINLENLPGPKRGQYPAHFFRDEAISSPGNSYFALAYTIAEASMCNDVGCILWGELKGSKANILFNLRNIHASCWHSPWCIWLNDETFIFKAQYYNGKMTQVPVVVISINKGFQVVPNSNSSESWLSSEIALGNDWLPIDNNLMIKVTRVRTSWTRLGVRTSWTQPVFL